MGKSSRLQRLKKWLSKQSVLAPFFFNVYISVFQQGFRVTPGFLEWLFGFRWNRPKLPRTKLATTVLCGCIAVPLFHSILATMNRIENSVINCFDLLLPLCYETLCHSVPWATQRLWMVSLQQKGWETLVYMGVRRNFSSGGKVDDLLIFFRLLALQRKWTHTKEKLCNVTATVAYSVLL